MEVLTITNRKPIQRYIAQGRLRWFGHLLRSPLNHPTHAIYTFNPRAAGWSRPRGAPCTRWSDVISKDLIQLGTTLTKASNIALDRTCWRSTIVARASLRPRGKSLSEVIKDKKDIGAECISHRLQCSAQVFKRAGCHLKRAHLVK